MQEYFYNALWLCLLPLFLCLLYVRISVGKDSYKRVRLSKFILTFYNESSLSSPKAMIAASE